ncbi:CRISPR type I-D/CYANO-associated protein Csc3/Cas10d [Seinonella peptonophila]|uniref:CRISPR type I-D/CYANO-associated protein Csc3/Cas10d n=1 Tax=Seinonella peptonophila TaxID=112248 RepID=A0A1M5B509_9BACL|nr:type I-D CRISPR-associated protein Cas10d/Csc3 [Seinonella peptonophila]SHF37641.1 CRISPR type I-D/CYANO-associated protein Csc3/Cas10d [Seinonella peptonophila]
MNIRSFAKELLLRFHELEIEGERFAEQEAKSHNYNPDRGLIDQSMWNHIHSGSEAFLTLVEYLEEQGLSFDVQEMQIALLGYVLHDLHKNQSLKEQSTSEYDLSLEDLEQVCLDLCRNLDVEIPPAIFIRAAGISNFSNKHGDKSFLSDEYRWTTILDWVKLMDKVASISSIAECKESALGGLRKLLRQILPPVFQKYELQYHWIQEFRGVLTTQLHDAISVVMLENGFFPWLRFGDGTLYLSFHLREKRSLLELAQEVKDHLSQSMMMVKDEMSEDKLFSRDTLECTTITYMLYQQPKEYARLFYKLFKGQGKYQEFPTDKFAADQLKKYGVSTHPQLWKRMNVKQDVSDDFREKWFFTARYFGALQRLIQKIDRSLTLSDAIKKIAQFFDLLYEDLLTLEPVIKCSNRRYDGHIWLAYRYLDSVRIDDRPIEQVSIEQYCMDIRKHAALFLQDYISASQVKNVVNQRLALDDELIRYMQEQVVLSWEQERILSPPIFDDLYKPKTRTHKRRCNICNRMIPSSVSEEKMKYSIIQDSVNVFSNQILPKPKNVEALHWCGICAYEFILRRTWEMDRQGKEENVQQIYLFAVPSYQFTDEVMSEFRQDLKGHFGTIHVHPHEGIRHAWQQPFVEQDVENIRAHLKKHFEIYYEYVQEQNALASTGDLLSAGPIGNFMLFSYQSYSSQLERTREEAWLKALSAALSLHLLYGFRIFLTEKPFLAITDLRELRYAIQLDAPPYKISRLLEPIEIRKTAEDIVPIEFVKPMMERLAIIWEVHRFVHPYDHKKPVDKQVSTILHAREINPLCGAYFFKRYLISSGQFYAPESFVTACKKLNQDTGGKLMSLIQEITEASLALYRPTIHSDGRAHRFENLFRTVIKGIREGREKAELQGLVMKRLERLVGQDGGYVVTLPIPIENVKYFVDLIYDQVYIGLCKGNLAKLNQRQNALADGVYFETYLTLQKLKAEKKGEE